MAVTTVVCVASIKDDKNRTLLGGCMELSIKEHRENTSFNIYKRFYIRISTWMQQNLSSHTMVFTKEWIQSS